MKGSRNDTANNRPVSLTSTPCEVMECIVRDTLLQFVTDKNMLSTWFQEKTRRSCLTNLLETFEAWTSTLDEGFGVDVMYLDYRKAFDTVPHNRLMLKQTNLGLHGDILRWIRKFITGRKIRVGLRGSFFSMDIRFQWCITRFHHSASVVLVLCERFARLDKE